MASSADGTKLAAGAFWEGLVEVSTNSGATWQKAAGAPTQGWMPVGWSGDGHVLITASGGQVSLSRSSPLDGYWSGIACSADGSRVNAAIDDYLDGPVYTGVFPRTGPILTTSPTNQAVVVGSNAG